MDYLSYVTSFFLILCRHKGQSVTSALVCPLDQFRLVCTTTSGTVIEWIVDFPDGVEDAGRQVISTAGPESLPPFVIRDSSVLLISRTSLSPLSSLLEISTTIADLNGTRIECTTRDGMETTVITIIGNVVPRANVSVVEEHYSLETVTIILEWSQGDGIIYDFTVSTSPPTSVQTNGTTGTRAELVLSYNARYSVSVVTQCGRNSTTNIQLHYDTCSLPVDLPPDATLTSSSSPALVGTIATVNCDEVNNAAIITCTEDGSWQPENVLNDTNLCNFESTTAVTTTHMAMQSHTDQTGTTTGTSIPTGHMEKSDPATIIISSSLGTIVLSIIFIIITGIVLFFVIKKAKQNGAKRAHEHGYEDEQHQMENNPSLTNDQNSNTGVYSLLQRPQSRDNTRNKHTNNLDGKKQTQLIYADIGPLSSKQSRAKADLRVFDDGDRVQYAQVNIGLLKQTHSSSVDKYPDIDNTLNLDCLLIQVKADVTPEWYQFGKAIGVSDEVLNKCLQYPPDESVIEVCDNWLRNHSGKPSWREVAEALRQINCQQLAFDIENSYNTGKLPKSLEEIKPAEEEMAPPIPPRLAL